MSVFRKIGRAKTVHSRHDLSYEVKLDAHFGKLYPVLIKHMLPSDVFKIGNEVVIRFMPMISPLLHQVDVFVHYFFIPYRLLWDKWEPFITGGEDGMDNSVQPLWKAETGSSSKQEDDEWHELLNYMGLGYPRNKEWHQYVNETGILCFPQRAYNFVWNEYYRDTQIQPEVSLDNNKLLYRSWMKDYFTSARLDTQLGEPPAIPIHGDLDILGTDAFFNVMGLQGLGVSNNRIVAQSTGSASNTISSHPDITALNGSTLVVPSNAQQGIGTIKLTDWLRDNVKVGGTAVDMNQLREIMAIQRWKERNARAGARYKEYIMARFRNYPRDDRLQRPEFIGGSRSPVIVSEVLQQAQGKELQSGKDTPIGEMYGHGITVDRTYVSKYRAYEYGMVLGLMSVMPKPSYSSPLEREWTYETRYDYFTPEFQTLGEQPIFLKELVSDADKPDEIFGYQGRYNELRYSPNKVVGLMRNDFAHWHLAREFDPQEASAPKLNDQFLQCKPDWERCFSVPSEPPMLVNFGNIINAVRPMVAVPNPGLLDHF